MDSRHQDGVFRLTWIHFTIRMIEEPINFMLYTSKVAQSVREAQSVGKAPNGAKAHHNVHGRLFARRHHQFHMGKDVVMKKSVLLLVLEA